MAGLPCTNLSTASQHGGLGGLAGSQSVHFLAVPLLWSIARRLRPDVRVLVCCESPATTLAAHKHAMCTALGELLPDWAVRLDAAPS
eukprot:5958778-Pyramimonas_sp.AAC.1